MVGGWKQPESALADPKPGELTVGRPMAAGSRRAAPVSVAKLWDDLRLGVISQSNLVIAGSPRNVFKYGGSEASPGVGWTLAGGKPRPLDPAKTGEGGPRQT